MSGWFASSAATTCASLGLLLFLLSSGMARTTCNDADCACVAFQPLSKELVCQHNCSDTDNVTYHWNLYRDSVPYNITFSSPPFSHVSAINVDQIARFMDILPNGNLEIRSINVHVHKADYTCWVLDSEGVQCGEKDFFSLNVISLFTALTQKPMVIDTHGRGIYGSPMVACVSGDTPGLHPNLTMWSKEITLLAADVTDESPNRYDCSDENKEYFLTLPSVQRRLQGEYDYSTFYISSKKIVVTGTDYSDCLDINNRYITFLVIRQVRMVDSGEWTVRVTSAYHEFKDAIFTVQASYMTVDTEMESIDANMRITSQDNAYVVCNVSYSIESPPQLHWKIQHDKKTVFPLNATVVSDAEDLPSREVELISETQLNELCETYGHIVNDSTVAFSIDYAPDYLLQFQSSEHNDALLQRQLLVLVLCDVGSEQIGTYTCIAPGEGTISRREVSTDVTVFDDSGTSGPGPTTINIGVSGGMARTTCNDADCACVAFQPLRKELVCQHNCSTTENVTYHWNLYRENELYNITFSSPPFSHVTVRDNVGHIVSIMDVLPNGNLEIDSINVHVHKAKYTCWVLDSEGVQCGETDFFSLNVISLFTALTQKPMVIDTHGRGIYGSPMVACVSGDTPGLHPNFTMWSKEITLLAANVTDESPNRYDCSDENKEYFLTLPSVQRRLQGEYDYSTFYISTKKIVVTGTDYSDCLDINNRYITFLVIRQVRMVDSGEWTVRVTSAYHEFKNAIFTVQASYMTVDTEMESIDVNRRITAQDNAYVVCNVSYSIESPPQLHWKIQHDKKTVFPLNATVVSDVEDLPSGEVELISKTQLNELCETYGHIVNDSTVAFSIDYAPDYLLQFQSSEHNDALLQRQLLVLVLCDVGSEQIGTYTCIAPGKGTISRREVSTDVTVFGDSGMSDSGPTTINIGAISGVIVVGVVIIIIMIILVYFGVRRYRQLKYEAMQMRPMTIPLAATQLANAVNHAFSSFSPIGSPMYDKFEFPRDNLELLETIGEGQFGIVWRARAYGICSEDSRNIVAVKTLKENFRDTDYYDLRSELDIMKTMEPHPNIINLLGVCSEVGASPLCILMEYAAYGSMKDYLAYCRRVMQAHAEGLMSPSLEEAYPLAAASNGAIIRQSMIMGDYPQLQQLPPSSWGGGATGGGGGGGDGVGAEGNDYLYDPMVVARTRRLVQMLKLQGYAPEELGAGGAYNHLTPQQTGGANQEEGGVSMYDMLYPNSQCVYRPCLEAYNYACYRGAQQQRKDVPEQEYYNAAAGGIIEEEEEEEEEGEKEGGERGAGEDVKISLEASSPGNIQSPPALTNDTTQLIPSSSSPPQVTVTNGPPLTPPPPSLSVSTPVRSKTKLGPTLSSPQALTAPHEPPISGLVSLSTSQDNVFESPSGSTNLMVTTSKEHMRESMISFPDGYIYAPPPTEGEQEGVKMLGAVGGGGGGMMMGVGNMMMVEPKKEKEPAPPMEEMITNLDLIDFGLQIARGMDHLERMQCVHRDLAARNILISEDFTLKIGDFGLARDLSDKDYYRKVTPGRLPARWMAPESLEERTHTYQSDVWSYGVVLWEILTYGEVPYRGQAEANDCDHLAYYLRCGNRLVPPSPTSDEFRDLLVACWMLNPDKRPSFSEIVSILDNQLSAAHGYLSMASAPVDRSSLHDQVSSTNPSPRMQKRKAMLQKLDKLQLGADRPVSLQPGAFSKSKLAKSPSLPIADPLKTSTSSSAQPNPYNDASPYLLPTPTQKVPPGTTLLSVGSPSSLYKYGSNPELSLSGREKLTEATVEEEEEVEKLLVVAVEKAQNGAVKANGHTANGHAANGNVLSNSIETTL